VCVYIYTVLHTPQSSPRLQIFDLANSHKLDIHGKCRRKLVRLRRQRGKVTKVFNSILLLSSVLCHLCHLCGSMSAFTEAQCLAHILCVCMYPRTLVYSRPLGMWVRNLEHVYVTEQVSKPRRTFSLVFTNYNSTKGRGWIKNDYADRKAAKEHTRGLCGLYGSRSFCVVAVSILLSQESEQAFFNKLLTTSSILCHKLCVTVMHVYEC
jgi:hypothetical protein